MTEEKEIELQKEIESLKEMTTIFKVITIIMFITISFLAYNYYVSPRIVIGTNDLDLIAKNTEQYLVCSSLTGTPAWVKNGTVFNYGYTNFTAINSSMNAVDEYLIPGRISFYYSSKCGWCHKQIQDFGDDWIKYQEAELTVDCYEVLNR